MMPVFNFIISSVLSFLALNILTHDKRGLNNRFPVLKIKFIQLTPHIRILVKGHFIWLHHWISFSLILIIAIVANGSFWDSIYTKGFLIGGILQGLQFPDWKYIYGKQNRLKLL
jgi:hypothetical protein